jgi:hypothetical protein
MKINVGGTIFEVAKDTLALAGKDSYFTIAERWATLTEIPFIDRDPEVFKYILDHLRGYGFPRDKDKETYRKIGVDLEFYCMQHHEPYLRDAEIASVRPKPPYLLDPTALRNYKAKHYQIWADREMMVTRCLDLKGQGCDDYHAITWRFQQIRELIVDYEWTERRPFTLEETLENAIYNLKTTLLKALSENSLNLLMGLLGERTDKSVNPNVLCLEYWKQELVKWLMGEETALFRDCELGPSARYHIYGYRSGLQRDPSFISGCERLQLSSPPSTPDMFLWPPVPEPASK